MDRTHAPISMPARRSATQWIRSKSAISDRLSALNASVKSDSEEGNDRSPCTACLRHFLDGFLFNSIVAMVVVVNFVVVIIQTDAHVSKEPQNEVLEFISLSCLGVYSLELACRVMIEGRTAVNSVHRCIDFALVGIDLLSYLLEAVLERLGEKDPGRFTLTIFRVFRLLRLVRGLRSTSYMRELYLMVMGMLATVRSIIWSTFLLALILATWSIITVVMINPINEELAEKGVYDGCERCARAYSSVWHASLTYFQSIIAGDSWGMVTIPIIEHSPWTIVVFLPAILFMALGLMNLVIMVICDSAAEARAQDVFLQTKEKRDQFHDMKSRLLKIWDRMDSNKNGEITFEELMQGYHTDTEFKRLLNQMDIYKSELGLVFKILDEDESGAVNLVEFVDSIYKMRMEDSHTLLIFIKSIMFDVHRSIKTLTRDASESVRQLPSQVGLTGEKLDLYTSIINTAAPAHSEDQVHASDAGVDRKLEGARPSVNAGPTLGGEAQGHQEIDGPLELTDAAIKDDIVDGGGNRVSKEAIWLSSQICAAHSRLRRDLLDLQREMLTRVDSQALLLQRSFLQGAHLQESCADVVQFLETDIVREPMAQHADSMSAAARTHSHEKLSL